MNKNEKTPKELAESTPLEVLGNPTESQIAGWEDEFKKIKKVQVDDKLFCFKQPTRPIVKAANTVLVNTKSVDDYGNVIISNCLINGKHLVDNDDEIYFALQAKVSEIITSKTAELGK